METETYYCHVQNGIVVIQESKNLEHGWFVWVDENKISLREIPFGGGNEHHIAYFNTIHDAINAGKKLT